MPLEDRNNPSRVQGILPPTISIEQPVEELTIDGARMVFQNTPGTEAPAEMNTWFPDFKAFWAAENIVKACTMFLRYEGRRCGMP
ncbi:alkyl sulfatase BDS1-like metallo-beta-lactamase superfamily hydrolase [Rhizobium sp. BK313]|nr:alkyl sulfatase BDS1-like metallo-beta-lactamase superfamily hydrolase [Rhizobium sp. BK313]